MTIKTYSPSRAARAATKTPRASRPLTECGNRNPVFFAVLTAVTLAAVLSGCSSASSAKNNEPRPQNGSDSSQSTSNLEGLPESITNFDQAIGCVNFAELPTSEQYSYVCAQTAGSTPDDLARGYTTGGALTTSMSTELSLVFYCGKGIASVSFALSYDGAPIIAPQSCKSNGAQSRGSISIPKDWVGKDLKLHPPVTRSPVIAAYAWS